MTDSNRFHDYIQRIRQGDAAAAEQLVREYEPVIRLEVRVRMYDPGLQRHFDSMDVCQSVLASFFVRAAAGQFDLNEPGELLRVLVAMARNKLVSEARRQNRQRRDQRRAAALPAELIDDAASPSRIVVGRELLQQVRTGLNDEERAIADLRGEGHGWPEIAQKLGGTPEARRKQFARALDRVAGALGIEEFGDEERSA